MKNRLLVQVSLTEAELSHCRSVLPASLQNFHEHLGSAVHILIVYQSEKGGLPSELIRALPGAEVETTSCFSVSAARNRGLVRARQDGFQYIYFHDARVFCHLSFLAMVKRAMEEDLALCLGRVRWSEQTLSNEQRRRVSRLCLPTSGHIRWRRPSPIRHTYLWAYLFRLELLTDLQFNPRVGPGREAVLPAGEDTLFLTQLLAVRPELRVSYFPRAQVCHPPRPADWSKHLAYARAQGTLLRFLVGQGFRPRWYFRLWLVLFIGAWIGRLLRLRKNSLACTREFIVGLRDPENLRSVLKSSDGKMKQEPV